MHCQRAVVLLLCFLFIFLLTACSNFHSFIADLNERHLSSCLCYQGAVAGGFGGAASLWLRGVTATGEATPAQCQAVCLDLGGPP